MSTLTWGDLGQQFDGPHATPVRTNEGPYFLNIASLDSGRLDLSRSDRVSDEQFVRWTRRVTPQGGDLLFSYETRLGEAALMPDGVKACLGRRMALLRPDPAVVHPRFLLYYYLSPEFQRIIAQRTVHGATVPRILLSDMPTWPVDLPSLKQQRAIAEVLGALDDKIAANLRLREMADDLISARFRALTVGVDWCLLGDVARINGVRVKPGAGTLRYIDIASVGVGQFEYPTPIEWTEAPSRARRAVNAGDTLWSTVRPNRRSHALVLDDAPDIVASTGLAVITPQRGDFARVYESTRLPEFTDYLVGAAEGSAYPAVRAERFEDAPVPDLGGEASAKFEEFAAPLRRRVHAADVENRSLGQLRDALLPQLMSGQVRVKDVEKQIEEAV